MISISAPRVDHIIKNMQDKGVLVIGDVMIDEYLWGKVNRLSPEAPVPIIEIEEESLRFGGAANVALNLRTLGCQPIIVGVIGKDRMADHFFELLEKYQLSAAGIIQSADRPTTVKTRIIGENQHIARVDREKATYLDRKQINQAMERIDTLMDKTEAVVMQDYNKGVLHKDIIRFSIEKANINKQITTVDPKFINFLEYSQATVFKPNLREASQALARMIQTEDEIRMAAKTLQETLNLGSVLLTLGSKGMALYEASSDYSRVPARTRKVADVSGAGDTVISTLTAALLGGASMKEAASLANYAAGVVCEEVGIVPIEKERLSSEIKNRSIQ